MGNLIVGAAVLLLVFLAIRSLYREKKRSGSCAFCPGATSGSCDHVGHRELDHPTKALTKEQQAILDRHTRKRS